MSQAPGVFIRPLPVFSASHAAITETFRKLQGRHHPSALRGRPLVALMLQDAKLPPSRPKDIPGTVKLWESPRQSRGVSRSSNQLELINGKVEIVCPVLRFVDILPVDDRTERR